MTCHLFGLFNAHDGKNCRRNVCQASVLEGNTLLCDEERHRIGGVRCIHLAGFIEHAVGIAVVCRDEKNRIRMVFELFHDSAHAGIDATERTRHVNKIR